MRACLSVLLARFPILSPPEAQITIDLSRGLTKPFCQLVTQFPPFMEGGGGEAEVDWSIAGAVSRRSVNHRRRLGSMLRV